MLCCFPFFSAVVFWSSKVASKVTESPSHFTLETLAVEPDLVTYEKSFGVLSLHESFFFLSLLGLSSSESESESESFFELLLRFESFLVALLFSLAIFPAPSVHF